MKFLHYRDLAKTETEFPISAEWGQGRSIFGGLTAALVLVHIESNVDLTGRDLRTVNIHFCGAVIADIPCEFRHRVLSQGRSVIQIEGQLLQEGETRHLGKLNPEDLEALALEEDPLIQLEALQALPVSMLGKRIIR